MKYDDVCVDPLEPNNTFSQAYNFSTSTYRNHNNLCLSASDEDWIKFTHNSETYYILIKGYSTSTEGAYGLYFVISFSNELTVYTYATDGSTDTKMYLYNSSLKQLAFDDDGGTGYFSRIDEPLGGVCSDPVEPNNTSSQAANLGTDFFNYNTLCLTPGDNDWFKFHHGSTFYIRVTGYSATTEGAYGLKLTGASGDFAIRTYEIDGSTDTKLYLYNSSLSQIAFDDDGGDGYFSLIYYYTSASESIRGQTTNVEEGIIEDQLSIFPNPTEGKFTVRMVKSNQEDNLTLEIMDATGKMLIQKQVHSTGSEFREDIDLSDQPAGMYFINLKGNDFQKVGKVVVK